MKLRRTKNIVVITIAACCSFTSCYDSALDFEQNGVIMGGSVDSIAAPELAMMYMREAQQRVIDTREHKYQYQFNLHIDDYAGYMSISHNFEGRMASSFAFYSDFCGGPWANFTWTAQQVVPVMNSAEKLGIKPIGAMATILYAYSAHQLANIHGPFPFKDFRALKEDHPLTYDKVSDIYTWTFEYLDQAIATLEEYKQKPNSETDDLIEKMDIIANVTGASAIVDQWIKFSNSLRLRMAMDIVKVDGYTYKGMTAQRIAEDAVNNHGGVLKAGDPTIGIDPSKKSAGIEYHPLFTISKGWNDTRLNASLENILKRTESPLLGRWFNKNKSALTSKVGVVTPLGSEYMGIRSGVYLEDRSKDRTYKVFSDLSEITMRMSISLIKVEEVLFLQAEGALRGWNMGGTPQSFYEAGIHESFMKNGMSEPDYDAYMKFQGMGSLANAEKSKKTAYKDYYEADNDLPRWDGYFQLNNAYSSIDGNPYTSVPSDQMKELSLEKIITQKWIALFPMSVVAWTDHRRTGYPRLIPGCDAAYGDADGSIFGEEIDWNTGETLNKNEVLTIRRLPYSTGGAKEVLTDIETTGLNALNESGTSKGDVQGTRLWWDIDKSNF